MVKIRCSIPAPGIGSVAPQLALVVGVLAALGLVTAAGREVREILSETTGRHVKQAIIDVAARVELSAYETPAFRPTNCPSGLPAFAGLQCHDFSTNGADDAGDSYTVTAGGKFIGFDATDAVLMLAVSKQSGPLDLPGHRVNRVGETIVLRNREGRPPSLLRRFGAAGTFEYQLAVPGHGAIDRVGAPAERDDETAHAVMERQQSGEQRGVRGQGQRHGRIGGVEAQALRREA